MVLRMLINALHKEEQRIAIADEGKLIELEIEKSNLHQLRGNIYKASIIRVEPSLQAAFLNIGSSKNGFLQINDIHPVYFRNWNFIRDKETTKIPPVKEVLSAGDSMIVQVIKDERDAKGATLTTNLSIPGRYLVLMIGNQRGGVSRKIDDELQRRRLKSTMKNLMIPPGMSVIIRTAGINKSSKELQEDLNNLLVIWKDIVANSINAPTPTLLYQEGDLIARFIRDYLRNDFEAVLVDNKEAYEKVLKFVERSIPIMKDKITFHKGPEPLFAKYELERQISSTNQATVQLPSGGSIVINPTEAVVAVDVNSGRATTQTDVEKTAFNTNLEAAEELPRQLRLRDLGGLIVIDFIDMNDRQHKQKVERTLKEATKKDKAKIEIGRISRFGLLEMSRQHLKASITSQNQVKCPHCMGKGRVKTAESVALEALRKVESAVFIGGVKGARLYLTPSAALFVLNEKRRSLDKMENAGATIKVYADSRLRFEDYKLMLDTATSDSKESSNETNTSQPREQRSHGRGNNRGRSHRNKKKNNRNRVSKQQQNKDFSDRKCNSQTETTTQIHEPI